MNRTKIKNYAPQARRDFIQAVKDRAAHFGLTETKTDPVVEMGDGVLIGGKAFTKKVGQQRKRLEERVKQHGFSATMEALAYTWFNRLVAIRFMEVNGYLANGEGGAGYRVLSNPNGKPTPELLDHADHAALPGLNKSKVIDLKIAGNKDAELYRMLLVAQCNALHTAMPFLFERIDDETELVLPESLLHTDSMIRKLATEIDEEDWKEVEIIGWLYEAYVSERYEQVIGDVVASEDIPAATQRFTPKWIVRYLVQNTLGRTWLATHPHSDVRGQMKYYIEPAEQPSEVRDALKAITPTELNPEEITLLDPACGSAHILVEAYDLFKLLYQAKGYERRKIPTLILTKNLFGLEIDDRAAQLAAFALLMKARADDRRLFEGETTVRPNVWALQDTKGLNAADLTAHLNEPVLTVELPPSDKLFEVDDDLFSKENMGVPGDIQQADIAQLIHLCENAKTFGSLIRIPPTLAENLPKIEERVRLVAAKSEDLFAQGAAEGFLRIVEQVKLLARRYSCVVANPPYMGSQYYASVLKNFVNMAYKDAKADLYACFIRRNAEFAEPNGFVGMITIPNWMFLSSFEEIRKSLLANQTIDSFIHNGRGIFGSDFGSCSFILRQVKLPTYRATFRRLFEKQGSVASNSDLENRFFTTGQFYCSSTELEAVPGSPLAFWISDSARKAFKRFPKLGERAKKGLSTGDNSQFIRYWHEINVADFSVMQGTKWHPVAKGGPFRRWYGNFDSVIDWKENGKRLRSFATDGGKQRSVIRNDSSYHQAGLTWNDVTIASFSARSVPLGFIPTDSGPMIYGGDLELTLCALNSKAVSEIAVFLSPTCHFSVGTVALFPIPTDRPSSTLVGTQAVELARNDWDSFETSWCFQTTPVIHHKYLSLRHSQEAADADCDVRFKRMKELEEENNRLFITAYGLQNELSPDVPDDQITLYRPNREEDTKRLVSYAIGCMMGRYSLDKPGLVYANAGNEGFDPGQYTTFPADSDGILPITELDWGFADDTAKRVEEFVSVAWPKEHLAENVKFIEDGLGTSIRKYLTTGFYKDHLRWYKRRPIYWMFSSGKLRAFQCLIYLHRYHEGTLARMRTEYVNPLQSKIAARLDTLDGDIAKAKGSLRTRLVREQDGLKKQQAELLTFDERLKHAADQRITLDLDDGVKVNYGKFGDLLAESKAVTGGKDEE